MKKHSAMSKASTRGSCYKDRKISLGYYNIQAISDFTKNTFDRVIAQNQNWF